MGQKNNIRRQLTFIELFKGERSFLLFILFLFVSASFIYPYPGLAMWFGFSVAAFSAISNDSIQTLGTFFSSNTRKKWWVLWLFIGGLFLATITISYVLFDGDVSYQRLATKGFDQAPTSFTYLQIAAPIFLIIFTRMRMPVSTTFLLLSSFAASTGAIAMVLSKSLVGYAIAFAFSFLIYVSVSKYLKKRFSGAPSDIWTVIQWISSGALWCLWIMQDAANIAIFLPRKLSLIEFLVFALVIFLGLGVLFHARGGRIQKIVTNKSDITDVRPATIVNIIFSILMAYHMIDSTVPMSTTWVFLGLLAGREVAMTLTKTSSKKMGFTLKMIGKDVGLALIGLIVSIVIASNSEMRYELYTWLGFM